jgi:hypothetical protein
VASSWWRIVVRTLNDVPTVVSCEPVEAAGTDSTDVFYVEACSKAEAGRKAWNEYCRVTKQRYREKLKAEGKCKWCARKNDRGADQRCSVCLLKDRERERNERARARGEDAPLPDRAAAIAARAQEERQAIRAEASAETRTAVLLEVQQAWRGAPNNAAFTRWLNDQVEKLLGRRVA